MESQFVRLKSGLKIHYLASGPENAPTVVLVHGWPTSSQLWRQIIPGLARHFRVLAPDLPGHGLSSKPEDAVYDLDFLYRFMCDFFDTVGLEKAHLAVHDLGGMAGLAFAVRDPERLDRLVVMNTGPYKEISFTLSVLLKVLGQSWLTWLFLWRPAFRRLMCQGIYHKERMTEELSEMYRATWAGTSAGRRAFSRTIGIPPARMVEAPEKLREIRIPTLILWGTKDGFFNFKVARRLHEDIKDSVLEAVPNASHFLQEDQPQKVLDNLAGFFAPEHQGGAV